MVAPSWAIDRIAKSRSNTSTAIGPIPNIDRLVLVIGL
jgi:hypothetical protein